MSIHGSPTKHLTDPVFGGTNGYIYQKKAVVCANVCKIWQWMPQRGVCALLRWLIALGFMQNWANHNKRRAYGTRLCFNLPNHQTSSTMPLLKMPTPVISTSTLMPGSRYSCGFLNLPTPPGVPVAITSPGSSLITVDA